MRPKGLVSKKITKGCPQCTLQVPTASKACSCGHLFKRSAPPSPPVMNTDQLGRRRTGRVKKEPNYFNTMEYDQHFKRKRRSASASEEVGKRKKPKNKALIPNPKDEDSKEGAASSSGDTSRSREEEKTKEDLNNVYANITPEKSLQYAIILAELNRKFLVQKFNPS